MMALTLLVVLASSFSASIAGTVQEGGACTQAHNHLQIGTFKFDGDCDSRSYCAEDGICKAKGCRRDIFPFGYPPGSELPPFCPDGEFCPDEGDACQPLLRVDSPCQLNRDDQCEPPPNFRELASSKYAQNHNGSVCLNFQCMWQNVTVGLPCVVENTAYIAYGGDSQEFIQVVSRGNCRPGLYCDSQQLVCMQNRGFGASCEADKECESNNCLSSRKCGTRADAVKHFPFYVYILVGIAIFGGMIGTLTGLFILHRRQRDADREKRIQYWREQNAFRQNIMQMRDTARASLLSLPFGAGGNGNSGSNTARSTIYSRDGLISEDSQQPMLSHQGAAGQIPRSGSSLRHVVDDEHDETLENYVSEKENDGPRLRYGRSF